MLSAVDDKEEYQHLREGKEASWKVSWRIAMEKAFQAADTGYVQRHVRRCGVFTWRTEVIHSFFLYKSCPRHHA